MLQMLQDASHNGHNVVMQVAPIIISPAMQFLTASIKPCLAMLCKLHASSVPFIFRALRLLAPVSKPRYTPTLVYPTIFQPRICSTYISVALSIMYIALSHAALMSLPHFTRKSTRSPTLRSTLKLVLMLV